MPSYLITGASRGLGFEFIRYLSQDPNNTVIGLVRNKTAADAKVKELGLNGIHIVEAQYTDLPSLKNAAKVVEGITEGLDYLVNNAAFVSDVTTWKTLGDFDDDFEALEKDTLKSLEVNLLGVIKTIQAFLPLIRKSTIKKVIALSTGIADIDLINDLEIPWGTSYAISKAALNVAIAKYNALYKKEGILFLSISPGFVATELNKIPPPPEDTGKAQELMQRFSQYAGPGFTGPITPLESVTALEKIFQNASIANGDGGQFISHLGNKRWL